MTCAVTRDSRRALVNHLDKTSPSTTSGTNRTNHLFAASPACQAAWPWPKFAIQPALSHRRQRNHSISPSSPSPLSPSPSPFARLPPAHAITKPAWGQITIEAPARPLRTSHSQPSRQLNQLPLLALGPGFASQQRTGQSPRTPGACPPAAYLGLNHPHHHPPPPAHPSYQTAAATNGAPLPPPRLTHHRRHIWHRNRPAITPPITAAAPACRRHRPSVVPVTGTWVS